MRDGPSRHYCVFRTDGIGDLMLTLPVANAVKRHDPASRVTFCVRSAVAELLRFAGDVDGVLTIDGRDVSSVIPFARRLRDARVDVALMAYPRPRLAIAAWKARIPVRVGTAFRWYSPFFTERIREHRSESLRHESEYNLSLPRVLGIPVQTTDRPLLTLDTDTRREAGRIFDEMGFQEDQPLVILHPGSAGSAKDWSPVKFRSLAERIRESFPACQVLVTGPEEERDLMQAVAGSVAKVLDTAIPLSSLAALIERASCLVANSTGPLHMAAALGVPVVGLYPNKRVCHPRRWGPLAVRSIVLIPPSDPVCTRCAREKCDVHDDMERIAVESVFSAVQSLLSGTKGKTESYNTMVSKSESR